MNDIGKAKEWRPGKYLETKMTHLQNYAIILLNRTVSFSNFDQLWNNASIRHVVDGGLNHFLNYREKQELTNDLKPPDILSGDLDSCLHTSHEYAKSVNCKIVCTPDQNKTDFTKALSILAPHLKVKMIKNVLVVVETFGRIDQFFANINTLFYANDILEDVELMMISSISLTWLLSSGTHQIHIPKEIVAAKYWCGLIPFSETKVTTSGLKWDLDNSTLAFGIMVSTSNTYKQDIEHVKIINDKPILWTMGTSAKEN